MLIWSINYTIIPLPTCKGRRHRSWGRSWEVPSCWPPLERPAKYKFDQGLKKVWQTARDKCTHPSASDIGKWLEYIWQAKALKSFSKRPFFICQKKNLSILFFLNSQIRQKFAFADLKKINCYSAHPAAKMILMLDRVEDSKDCCWGAAEDTEQD